MTQDEMERTIQFILQQQAQFAAQHARTETQIGKLTDAMLTITGVIGKLAESQARTEGRMTKSEELMNALMQAQARTEERLNAFIAFVERYISERRNGKR